MYFSNPYQKISEIFTQPLTGMKIPDIIILPIFSLSALHTPFHQYDTSYSE